MDFDDLDGVSKEKIIISEIWQNSFHLCGRILNYR